MEFNNITVVITSFKSEKKIIKCLNSIDVNIRTLVIENSKNYDLGRELEKKYKNVECIVAKENLGYAKGNNFGLLRVKTKYALIINPDAYLKDTAITNFFSSVKKVPDFSIIAPFIQEEVDLQKGKDEKNLVEVNDVKGFAMFLNMEKIKKVGFFDSNFFIYFEEIDLCRRLKKNNEKIYLDPSIEVFHAGGRSHDETINFEMEVFRNWHWMWSTFYFHKKHNGYFFALIKIFPKFISSIMKTFYFLIFFNRKNLNIYFARLSGIVCSILLLKSWYRPKVS